MSTTTNIVVNTCTIDIVHLPNNVQADLGIVLHKLYIIYNTPSVMSSDYNLYSQDINGLTR